VIAAYRLTTNFLRGYFRGDESFASKRDFLEFLLGQVRALSRPCICAPRVAGAWQDGVAGLQGRPSAVWSVPPINGPVPHAGGD
jgi:hypothetical protein